MNILGILLVTLYLFIPWVGRAGTNVNVRVNNSCGGVANKVFVIKLNNGEILSGVTDENGEWQATTNSIVSGGVYESSTMLLTERSFPTVNSGVWELYFQEYKTQC